MSQSANFKLNWKHLANGAPFSGARLSIYELLIGRDSVDGYLCPHPAFGCARVLGYKS